MMLRPVGPAVLVAWSVGIFACWSAEVRAIRPKAGEALRCDPRDVDVTVRSGVARASGCHAEALFLKDPSDGAWDLESVYPTNKAGTAFVPACEGGAYRRFVSDEPEAAPVELREGSPSADGTTPPKLVTSVLFGYREDVPLHGQIHQEGNLGLNADIDARCHLDRLGLLECCDFSGVGPLSAFEDDVRTGLARRRYEPAKKAGHEIECNFTIRLRFRTSE